jgi:hypothetical protein
MFLAICRAPCNSIGVYCSLQHFRPFFSQQNKRPSVCAVLIGVFFNIAVEIIRRCRFTIAAFT